MIYRRFVYGNQKKVVELLQALETRDPKADVVFDNYKNYDEFLPGYTYDLNSISIRSKDSKLVIGLALTNVLIATLNHTVE